MQTPSEPKDWRTALSYLPRLPRPFYQADATVHWIITSNRRVQWELGSMLHGAFRELVLHACAREYMMCPVYCLMPDHLHMVWTGLARVSDQLKGMAFFRTHFSRVIHPVELQSQAYDRVLRNRTDEQDGIRTWIQYAVLNPILAELAEEPSDWPWLGCVIPGLPRLHPLDDRFWKVMEGEYRRRRDPQCSMHVLPMLG